MNRSPQNPKTPAAEAEALAAALPALQVEAERVAATVHQGLHSRRRAGRGDSFWQYRRYMPGDAPRSIDWRRSAKSDPAQRAGGIFIRQREWETEQSTWLWCAGGAAMNWHSPWATTTKRHRAVVLALALASLLARGGERITLAGSGQPPLGGRAAVPMITRLLSDPGYDHGDLPSGLRLPAHSTLVCFADFLTPIEEIAENFDFLAAQKLQVWLVQILDPAEQSLPYHGRIQFQQPAGDRNWLIPDVDSVRDSYQQRLAQHNENLKSLAEKWGWRCLLHLTDSPPESALLTLYCGLSGASRQGNRRAAETRHV